MTDDILLKRLQELLMEGLSRVPASNWSGFYWCVVSLENDYWVKESVIEDATDSFIVKLKDC
jgi:hypothetical protein